MRLYRARPVMTPLRASWSADRPKRRLKCQPLLIVTVERSTLASAWRCLVRPLVIGLISVKRKTPRFKLLLMAARESVKRRRWLTAVLLFF